MPIAAIDTAKETAYPISELGKHLPNRPGYWTVYRWVTVGMWNWNRTQRIKLAKVFISRRMHSSVEAYHRMVKEANER